MEIALENLSLALDALQEATGRMAPRRRWDRLREIASRHQADRFTVQKALDQFLAVPKDDLVSASAPGAELSDFPKVTAAIEALTDASTQMADDTDTALTQTPKAIAHAFCGEAIVALLVQMACGIEEESASGWTLASLSFMEAFTNDPWPGEIDIDMSRGPHHSLVGIWASLDDDQRRRVGEKAFTQLLA